jgi:hypothetical protein
VPEWLTQLRDRTYEELAEEFSRLDAHAAISSRPAGTRRADMAGQATRRALQALFGRSADELLRPWTPGLALSTRPPIDGPSVPP